MEAFALVFVNVAFLVELFAVSLVQHLLLDAVVNVIRSHFVQMSSIFSVNLFTTKVVR